MTDQQRAELGQLKEFLDRTDTDKKILENYKAKLSDVSEIRFVDNLYCSIMELYSILVSINAYIQQSEIPEVYFKIIRNNVNALRIVHGPSLWFLGLKLDTEPSEYGPLIEHSAKVEEFHKHFDIFKFNWTFFNSIQFLTQNLVIVGANGSGKTTLAKKLKETIQVNKGEDEDNGLVISAARTMFIPQVMNIVSEVSAEKAFKEMGAKVKDTKPPYNETNLSSEFRVLLNLLIAQYISAVGKQGVATAVQEKENTILMKVIKLWNSLILDRAIEFDSRSCELNVVDNTGGQYSISELSDGEKSVLFIAAYVLLTANNSIIIIDEPELHLHKAIVGKLFDALECEKNDCLFIYITHDIEFAESRINAKKLWLKQFVPSKDNEIDIEHIDNNILPEGLLLKILGSRKPILFCEGEKSSLDKSIYDILLPNFTVIPAGGCNQVKSYTKTYNHLKINGKPKAYGIIDRDYNDDKFFGDLEKDNIYAHDYAEIENLLLEDKLLKLFLNSIGLSESIADNVVCDIMDDWAKNIEGQAVSYVRSKLNAYLKCKTINSTAINEIKAEFNALQSERDVDALFVNKMTELTNINTYAEVLKYYNDKGLDRFVKQRVGVNDYKREIISFVCGNNEAKSILSDLLPKRLVEIGSCVVNE